MVKGRLMECGRIGKTQVDVEDYEGKRMVQGDETSKSKWCDHFRTFNM